MAVSRRLEKFEPRLELSSTPCKLLARRTKESSQLLELVLRAPMAGHTEAEIAKIGLSEGCPLKPHSILSS